MAKKRKSRSKSRKSRKSKGSGLFKPPRWKYLADIITFESPSKARKSAKEVLKDIKKSKRRDKVLREARALQYAANRARAAAKRKNLSPEERRELKEIAEIYEDAAEEAWGIYHERFKD